jgi:ribosomal protein S28E/S33
MNVLELSKLTTNIPKVKISTNNPVQQTREISYVVKAPVQVADIGRL